MMKHGRCETIHNTVFYHQTPFNIAVIIEQLSNYDKILREQANMEKAVCSMKINTMSEEKMCKSRMRATAKEHEPEVSYDANANKERTEMNEAKWVKPRNCVSINNFFKPCENTGE